MAGERIPRSKTILPPNARGTRGLFQDASPRAARYERPFLAEAGFESLDTGATSSSATLCGPVEDQRELQRI
eukprot:5221990-Pyramimonas_sp.AAC.1